MTEARAIRATYETYKHVPTRKVVQIVLEVPAEGQAHLFATLGYPNPSESVWVAVALLRPEATVEENATVDPIAIEPPHKPKSLAQIAGILCNEGAFRKFIRVETVDQAAEYIRAHCNVSSRANIDGNPDATAAFHALKGEYDLWMRVDA